MKILVISDTHGLLRPEVAEQIKNSDAVIHGGDIDNKETLDELKSHLRSGVSLFAVRGNNDGSWASELPKSLEFKLCGLKFFVVHNRKDVPKDVNADIIIFGHTHRFFEERSGGKLLLNPGSCGKRRFGLPLTMAYIIADVDGYSVTKSEIGEKDKAVMTAAVKNLPKSIQNIMKRMDRKETSSAIAEKLKLDHEFVEQVIRLRVTHPGIDADGIMNKIANTEQLKNQKSAGR